MNQSMSEMMQENPRGKGSLWLFSSTVLERVFERNKHKRLNGHWRLIVYSSFDRYS